MYLLINYIFLMLDRRGACSNKRRRWVTHMGRQTFKNTKVQQRDYSNIAASTFIFKARHTIKIFGMFALKLPV